MKVLKIDHLGIAVPSLDQAVKAYEALGFAVESTHDVIVWMSRSLRRRSFAKWP